MNLNKAYSTLIVLLSVGSTSLSQAANTANIEITGSVEPTACEVSVTGEANFGALKRSDLKVSSADVNYLQPRSGAKTVDFAITCDGRARTGVTFLAAAAGTKPNTGTLKNNTKDVGLYELKMQSIKVDSAAGKVLTSNTTGNRTYTQKAMGQTLALNKAEMLNWSTADGTSPVAAKVVNGTVAIDILLNEAELSNMKDKIDFKGSTVIELAYP